MYTRIDSQADFEPANASRCSNHTPRPGNTSGARQLAIISHQEVVHAFNRTGGIFPADEVESLLEGKVERPLSNLARWLAAREVVSFPWQSRIMVPLFQFNLVDMTLRPGVSQVTFELIDIFDDWDMTCWFVRPNSSLGGATPLDLMETNQPAVRQAARLDRFLVRG